MIRTEDARAAGVLESLYTDIVFYRDRNWERGCFARRSLSIDFIRAFQCPFSVDFEEGVQRFVQFFGGIESRFNGKVRGSIAARDTISQISKCRFGKVHIVILL